MKLFMAERDPIDVIREQIARADGLFELNPDQELFKSWQAETKAILEKIFTSRSIHSQNFVALRFRVTDVKVFASPEIDKMNSARYKKDLENAKAMLQAAIKELNLDRTLFKRIQTTPKSVEVSLQGEYYLSSGISDPETKRVIRSVFEASGVKPVSPAGTEGESLSSRMDQIRRARFGIYEIPSDDPSGLLELGIAIGMGKDITVLCRRGCDLPDALRQLGPIEYHDLSELAEKLKKKFC
jgi:hypothetical protein